MTNLEKVLYYFKDVESPTHFIEWTYLYTISACLGRRVHMQNEEFPIFPNQYIFIVGPPAVGKSITANRMTKMVRELVTPSTNLKSMVPMVNITPECVTLEELYNFIENSISAIKRPDGSFYHHASVSFCLGDEIALLFQRRETSYDLANFLIKGYECGSFQYSTKSKGKNDIKNMCVNFLGCCTPEWVSGTITGKFIEGGFASRVVFLYGGEKRQRTTFLSIDQDQLQAMEAVKAHWRKLSKLYGQVHLTDKAHKWIDDWYQTKDTYANRVNKDQKLNFYYERRKTHLYKVACACHFSERLDMLLEEEDFIKADLLLSKAEVPMNKALTAESRNPISDLADRIYKIVGLEGGLSKQQILLKVYDGGNLREIGEAIEVLQKVDKIVQCSGTYVISKNGLDGSAGVETEKDDSI